MLKFGFRRLLSVALLSLANGPSDFLQMAVGLEEGETQLNWTNSTPEVNSTQLWSQMTAVDNQMRAQTNNETSDQVPLYMQHMTLVLVILHASVFISGLIGNALVCLSVFRNKSLQTVTNYYIVNLAVADFLVILICLPPTVYWDLTLTWNFGLVSCKLVLYLQSISVSVSVLTLTCISLDRWYAICKPLQFTSTKFRAKVTIGLIWLLSLIIGSPEVLFLTTRPLYEENDYIYMDCTYSWPEQNTKIYQLCIVTLLFIGPFLLMSISYSNIVNVLWRDETMIASMQQHTQLDYETDSVQFKGSRSVKSMACEDAISMHSKQRNCNEEDCEQTKHLATSKVHSGQNDFHLQSHSMSSKLNDKKKNKKKPNESFALLRDQHGNCFRANEQFHIADVADLTSPNKGTEACRVSLGAVSGENDRPVEGRSCLIVSHSGQEHGSRVQLDDRKPSLVESVGGKSICSTENSNEEPLGSGEKTTKKEEEPSGKLEAAASRSSVQPDLSKLNSMAELKLATTSTSATTTTSSDTNQTVEKTKSGTRLFSGCGCLSSIVWKQDSSLISGDSRKQPSLANEPDKSMPKKYRRNLANYAAKRSKYIEASGNNLTTSKSARLQRNSSFQSQQLQRRQENARLFPASLNLGQIKAGSCRALTRIKFAPNKCNTGPNSQVTGYLNGPDGDDACQSSTGAQMMLGSAARNKSGTSLIVPRTSELYSNQQPAQTRFCKLIESRKKAAKMLIVIVIMFGLCYLPVHFLNILRYTIGLPQNDFTTIASLVSHWLCYFNSAVNPLIYNLMSGKFRHEFANLFFCRCFRRGS